jgi:hypothetical protein
MQEAGCLGRLPHGNIWVISILVPTSALNSGFCRVFCTDIMSSRQSSEWCPWDADAHAELAIVVPEQDTSGHLIILFP